MLEWTGERFLPWIEGAQIHYEHLHRYAFATQLVKGKKVLDLAYGEGYGPYMLSKEAKYVVAIEIDEQAVKHAKSRYLRENLEFIQGSILEVPIKSDKNFDVIICFEGIEHIEQHDKLLSEVKRLLKDEGLFIVSTPNREAYTDEANYENPFHTKELYFDQFKILLRSYFKNVKFLGQRVYSGSNLWDISSKEYSSYKEFLIEKNGKEFYFTESDSKVPLYFIALASDANLEPRIVNVNNWLVDVSDALVKDYLMQLNKLNNTLQAKDSQILDLETKIQLIQGSIIMQIFNRYQRVIEKLLPWGTRRRYYYDLWLTSIRVILNEGWRQFFRKARMWLRSRRLLGKIQVLEFPTSDVSISKKETERTIFSPTSQGAEQRSWTYEEYSKVRSLSASEVVDIVICVGGNADLVHQCIDSIKKHTVLDAYRLHLVVHEKDIQVIGPEIRAGANIVTHAMDVFNFAKANNMVIAHCTGDVILLNDDTVVTSDWLEALKRDSKGLALTGAHTGFQCAGNPDMWGNQPCAITWYPINMFCAYIPKRILDVVGTLDEEFCYYGGEDVDYSCRALQHGFPLVISSAYVHHRGNQAFGESKARLMEESNKVLYERYGISAPFNLEEIKPLVSVIMATRNRAQLLPVAARSILKGSYPKIQLIIVDDASDDQSWNVINDLQRSDQRVIGIRLPKNAGCVGARHIGFRASSGQFIAFMDDDDVARPNRIMAPLQHFLTHPELDVVYCSYEVVSEGKSELGRTQDFNAEDYLNMKFDIGSGIMLIRRKIIDEVPFMSLYEKAIDYDWVFRIIRRGYKIDYCPSVVLDYNKTGPTTSHLSGNLDSLKVHKAIQERERVINENRRI